MVDGPVEPVDGPVDTADADGRPPSHMEVPRPVRVAADWAWRLLVIAAAVLALLLLADRLKLLILAVFVATLLTALLLPGGALACSAGSRGRAGSPRRWCSSSLVGVLALLLAALAVADRRLVHRPGRQVRRRAARRSAAGCATRSASTTRPCSATCSRRGTRSRPTATACCPGRCPGTRIALEVLSGAAIALFATVFMLLDGEGIWAWCVRLFPRRSQGGDARGRAAQLAGPHRVRPRHGADRLRGRGERSGWPSPSCACRSRCRWPRWCSSVRSCRSSGAFVSGFVAVVVALAARGPIAALLVLAAIIVVQQVEGHLLQPLVMGRLVRLHPLGVVLAVTAGTVLAGLVGAVVAVPLAAVLVTVFGYYAARSRARGDPGAVTDAAATAGRGTRPSPAGRRRRGVRCSRSVRCASARTMSRTDRIPATSPSSSTTRCRKPPRSIASAASSSVQSGRRVDDVRGEVRRHRLHVRVRALGDGDEHVALGQDPRALAVGVDHDRGADLAGSASPR